MESIIAIIFSIILAVVVVSGAVWIFYFIIKKSIKDALKEYDKEKNIK